MSKNRTIKVLLIKSSFHLYAKPYVYVNGYPMLVRNPDPVKSNSSIIQMLPFIVDSWSYLIDMKR
jgi:hypothetical protein